MNEIETSRRHFVKKIGALGLLAPFTGIVFGQLAQIDKPLEVHIFSKHLHFLDYHEAAETAAEIGFKGLDLTVRPKGHVLPENVIKDLPSAVGAIKKAGLKCEMITTAVSDVENQLDADVIKVAAGEGVKFYRSNWFEYKKDLSLEESLDFYKERVRQLSEFNKEHNIVGCYQNHSGIKIGASVWEVRKILETADTDFFGAQYDIRHAVVEGGRSWPNGIKLLKKHIKTVALKDFKWGKVNGQWKIVNVPIGEGMIDFKNYFKMLKSYSLKPPVSLHLEYPLGGADKGRRELTVDKKVVFDAMKKDLSLIQKIWKVA